MGNQEQDRVEVWLGFLQSVIWPITVLVIVALLRGDISVLLGRVNKVNVAGTAIELF